MLKFLEACKFSNTSKSAYDCGRKVWYIKG